MTTDKMYSVEIVFIIALKKLGSEVFFSVFQCFLRTSNDFFIFKDSGISNKFEESGVFRLKCFIGLNAQLKKRSFKYQLLSYGKSTIYTTQKKFIFF
jgi:hypothetical protein